VATPPAAGEVFEGNPPNLLPTPTLPAPPMLLYRFGVLLAANASAQQLFPELPVASTDEQAFAQQLAAHLSGG
jgi:hypothetical protein